MITIIRGCVTCYFFQTLVIWIFGNFFNSFGFHLEKSTILLAFFPYLAQIIISIRGCVACNDFWPWPIFSRSFGLDLENRVHSVASTVLNGFFPYLQQMITSIRRCEFDLFDPKFPFCLDLFGSNFQWPAVHPHRFSSHPPPGGVLPRIIMV